LRLRIRPCVGPRAEARGGGRGQGPRAPARRQSLRPRRQGCGAGAEAARAAYMSRYEAMFARLRARNEGAFGAFAMLGDPDLERSAAILDALVEGGADMLEVGIPFS